MVRDADYGFFIWDGKSKGTLKSVVGLVALQKHLLLYYQPSRQFHTLTSKESLSKFLVSIGLYDPETGVALESESQNNPVDAQNSLRF